MVAIQRTAGNRAATDLVLGRAEVAAPPTQVAVQRFDAKKYAGLDPVAAVGKALGDDEEGDAHELMRKLDNDEQATQVLLKFQHKATSCFGNNTMGTAAWILVGKGGRLDLALKWMFDEGTNWSLLQRVVAACTNEGHKKLVRTDHFMGLFVEEVNDDEMDRLVDLLGGDVIYKLHWMFAEGTSYGRVKAKLEAAKKLDPGSMAALRTQAWRDFFVKQYGNDEIAELAGIIGGDLPTKLLWMIDEGTDWTHIKATIEGAPGEAAKIVDDAWMHRFVKALDDKEMAALVKMVPLDLPGKLKWLQAEGSNWGLMKDVISSVPAPDRAKVVEDDSLRHLFVSECGDAEMYEAVKLLGGPLSKQLAWMAAEDCEDAWIEERITTITDANERLRVYFEKLAAERIMQIKAAKRVALIKLLGGTPDEQLYLFSNDIEIGLLTWATPSADWVAAIMKYRRNPLDLLEVAKGDTGTWGPLIQPKLWDLLKDFHDTLHPEERVKVFWAAYGNGAAFNAGQIMHFIGVLTGKEPHRTGETLNGTYKVLDPNDAAAREFMNILMPGGSSGALGIARDELARGELAFCSDEKDKNGVFQPITTSYFADPYIIIRVDAAGARSTSGLGATSGTPEAVGTGLDFFQNHVRHEIGHAVGADKIGKMSERGNHFAEVYGGWKKSSASTFTTALWSDVAKPAAGWPSVAIAGANVTLTNDAVRDWCIGILDDGKEKQNAIGKAAGNLQVKLAAIQGSLWAGVKLVDYLVRIGANDCDGMRNNAYEFGGFTPTDPVQIYATRWGDDFVQYSKAAHDAFQAISWYALSSPYEMFAEMYTARYAQKTLPVPVNGKDPADFFSKLEAQRDPMFGK